MTGADRCVKEHNKVKRLKSQAQRAVRQSSSTHFAPGLKSWSAVCLTLSGGGCASSPLRREAQSWRRPFLRLPRVVLDPAFQKQNVRGRGDDAQSRHTYHINSHTPADISCRMAVKTFEKQIKHKIANQTLTTPVIPFRGDKENNKHTQATSPSRRLHDHFTRTKSNLKPSTKTQGSCSKH